MSANKSSKKRAPVGCGEVDQELCSELFVEVYSVKMLKDYLLNFYDQWKPIFPRLFDDWETNGITNKISAHFLDTYADQLFSQIKGVIVRNETILSKYVSQNFQNTVDDLAKRYIAGNKKQYFALKSYTATNNVRRKSVRGGVDNIRSSQLFLQKYPVDRMKEIAIRLYLRYKDLMQPWPEDKETGLLDDKYVTNYAKGLIEYIKDEIRTSERRNPNYRIRNLNYVINDKARSFVLGEIKDINRPRRRLVNDKVLEFLRNELWMPNLTIDDLKNFVHKRRSETVTRLTDALFDHKALNKVWFKIEYWDYTGNREVYIYLPEQCVTILYYYSYSSMTSRLGEDQNGVDYEGEDPSDDHHLAEDKELISEMVEVLPIPDDFEIGKVEMKDDWLERMEEFYKNLNDKERCVLKHSWLELLPHAEVAGLCWDPPVSDVAVTRVRNNVERKYLKYVMEYSEKEIERYMKKDKKKGKDEKTKGEDSKKEESN